MESRQKYHGSANYRIKLKGCLDPKWSDWFEQMAIFTDRGNTILTGPVADQAALHGLLTRIHDLNLTLLSVERLKSAQHKKHEIT